MADDVWFCCGELAKGEHHLACLRHPKNRAELAKAMAEDGLTIAEVIKQRAAAKEPDLLAATREISRK